MNLKVGDKVHIDMNLCGMDDWYMSITTRIEIVKVGWRDGESVSEADIYKDRVVISLENNKWAYGDQIMRINGVKTNKYEIKGRYEV